MTFRPELTGSCDKLSFETEEKEKNMCFFGKYFSIIWDNFKFCPTQEPQPHNALVNAFVYAQ